MIAVVGGIALTIFGAGVVVGIGLGLLLRSAAAADRAYAARQRWEPRH